VLPELVTVLAEGVKEAGITKMRCPAENLAIYEHFASSPSRQFYETVSAQGAAARVVYAEHGFKFTDVSSLRVFFEGRPTDHHPPFPEICWKRLDGS